MHFIEHGVRRKVLDFLLNGKAILYGFYGKWTSKTSS